MRPPSIAIAHDPTGHPPILRGRCHRRRPTRERSKDPTVVGQRLKGGGPSVAGGWLARRCRWSRLQCRNRHIRQGSGRRHLSTPASMPNKCGSGERSCTVRASQDQSIGGEWWTRPGPTRSLDCQRPPHRDHYADAVFSEPGHNERESRGHAWFARVVRDRISSQRLRVDARSLPSSFGSLLR